jgi:site-specific DNA-methyltransferase (adenine-specific)
MELYNENSLYKLKELPNNSVDCCITDPPYFIDKMASEWDLAKLKASAQKAGVVGGMPVGMKFDPQQGKDLEKFMHEISTELYRILKPGAFFLSFSAPRLYHRMACGIENAGFEIRDEYIWKRPGQAKAFSQTHFVQKMKISDEEKAKIIASLDNRKTPQLKPEFEAIVMAQKPREDTFVKNWMKYGVGLVDVSQSLDGMFPGTIMDVPKDQNNIPHFTVKPIKLIEHLIKLFTQEGATIIDPFMGSGTTGIACINTNRDFIGIELSEEYFQLSEKRLAAAMQE